MVSENRIRGTVEKVFSLSATLESATTKEIEEAYLEDHPKVDRVILLGHSEACTLIAAASRSGWKDITDSHA